MQLRRIILCVAADPGTEEIAVRIPLNFNEVEPAQPVVRVGFQNSVTGPDLGLLCGSLVLVDEAAEYRPAPYPLPGGP
jgi:hypothetical protein